MEHQIGVVKRIRKPPKCTVNEIDGNLMIGCMHVIQLSHGVYCALRRMKIDGYTCEGCPNFNPEPIEYSLFRRR